MSLWAYGEEMAPVTASPWAGQKKKRERGQPEFLLRNLCVEMVEGEADGGGLLPGTPNPLRSSPSGTHSKHPLSLGNQSFEAAESRPGHIPGKVGPQVSTQCQAGLTSSGGPRPPWFSFADSLPFL